MPERRKTKRRHLYDFFDVYEQGSDKLFGQLVDITVEGIKIMSTSNVVPESKFSLKIIFPPQMKVDNILLNVKCIWNRGPNSDNYYDTGFKILNISEKDLALIQTIF